MTADATETDKTGPETRAQPVQALADAEASTGRAESRTEPAGATAILRLIAHGRGCECDLCANPHAKTDRSQP